MEVGILLFSTQVNLLIKNIYCSLSPAGFISDVVGAVLFPHHFSIRAVSIAENHLWESLCRRGWCRSEAVSEKTFSLHMYSDCLAMSKVKALNNLAWNWELKSPGCRVLGSFQSLSSCCSIARFGNVTSLQNSSIKAGNASICFSLALGISVTLKQNFLFW